MEGGLFPFKNWIANEGKTIFVANMSSGTVNVIDIEMKKVARNLEVDDGFEKVQNEPINQRGRGMEYTSIEILKKLRDILYTSCVPRPLHFKDVLRAA